MSRHDEKEWRAQHQGHAARARLHQRAAHNLNQWKSSRRRLSVWARLVQWLRS